jgi:K+-transporting ATPase KdpF subunit
MSATTATIIFSHMSTTDLFGLIVSIIICGYLLYALLRGEKF